jgi:hypothetical protein
MEKEQCKETCLDCYWYSRNLIEYWDHSCRLFFSVIGINNLDICSNFDEDNKEITVEVVIERIMNLLKFNSKMYLTINYISKVATEINPIVGDKMILEIEGLPGRIGEFSSLGHDVVKQLIIQEKVTLSPKNWANVSFAGNENLKSFYGLTEIIRLWQIEDSN